MVFFVPSLSPLSRPRPPLLLLLSLSPNSNAESAKTTQSRAVVSAQQSRHEQSRRPSVATRSSSSASFGDASAGAGASSDSDTDDLEDNSAFKRARWGTFIAMFVGYGAFYLTRNSLAFTAPAMLEDKSLGLTLKVSREVVFSVEFLRGFPTFPTLFLTFISPSLSILSPVRRRPHLGAACHVRRFEIRLGRPRGTHSPHALARRRPRGDGPRQHLRGRFFLFPALHALLGHQRTAPGAGCTGLRAHPHFLVPRGAPRDLLGILDGLEQRRRLLRSYLGRLGCRGLRVEVGDVCSGAGRDRVEFGKRKEEGGVEWERESFLFV